MEVEKIKRFLNKKVCITTDKNFMYHTDKFILDEKDGSIFFLDKFQNQILLAVSEIKTLAEVK